MGSLQDNIGVSHVKAFNRLLGFWFGLLAVLWVSSARADDIQIWGRPIVFWLDEMTNVAMAADPQAKEAFKVLGTNAIPFLISVAEHKPPPPSEATNELETKYPQARGLSNTRDLDFRREIALMLLGDLRDKAAPAIPPLVKIWCDQTDDGAARNQAEATLSSMGDKVADYAPEFIARLGNTNYWKNLGAIVLTGHCGPKARAAIPVLLNFVNNTDISVRREAAEALWKIDRNTNVALQVYSGLLMTEDPGWMVFDGLFQMAMPRAPQSRRYCIA
jgi:hypothetical protein